MAAEAPRPHRPPIVRAMNAFGGLVRRLGMRVPGLEPDALEAAARARTGLSDFGADDYREGLERLVESIEGDAKPNFIGWIAARSQIVDLLAARLELVAYRERHPDLAGEKVEKPLFILGLPRTGTTLLYELVALDPAHRTPVTWELYRPDPPAERATYHSDSRIAPIEKTIDQFKKMVPGVDAMHPIGATLPQECLVITAPSFRSIQFELTFAVARYVRWYLGANLAPAYRFHRRFLQHLQSRYRGDRWVLKSPAHLGHLDSLFAEYPDALVVQTHRDPVEVIPSVSSLHHKLRGFGSDEVDAASVGPEQAGFWAEFLGRALATRRRGGAAVDRILDVRFEEVLADPIAVVERIYERFELPLTGSTVDAMRAYLASHPRDRHGVHRYAPETFGLTADSLRDVFRDYRAEYGLGR